MLLTLSLCTKHVCSIRLPAKEARETDPFSYLIVWGQDLGQFRTQQPVIFISSLSDCLGTFGLLGSTWVSLQTAVAVGKVGWLLVFSFLPISLLSPFSVYSVKYFRDFGLFRLHGLYIRCWCPHLFRAIIVSRWPGPFLPNCAPTWSSARVDRSSPTALLTLSLVSSTSWAN